MKKKIAITPVRVADLLAEGERMPVYVHVIDHPDKLIETGALSNGIIIANYKRLGELKTGSFVD
ncbi:MAG TPA: hypothetical protein VFQ13_06545 [Anaerolineales bacterium]|nr:hypothetical protein [Anaerolineales bacterium]